MRLAARGWWEKNKVSIIGKKPKKKFPPIPQACLDVKDSLLFERSFYAAIILLRYYNALALSRGPGLLQLNARR